MIGLGVTAADVGGVEGLLLSVGAEEACVGLLNTDDVTVLPVVVGGLGARIVAFNSGFLNVPGVVVVVVLGAAALVVTGDFVNEVVALLFGEPLNVRLEVTVGLAEAVVLVVLGLLNECAEVVVGAVVFFSSAL